MLRDITRRNLYGLLLATLMLSGCDNTLNDPVFTAEEVINENGLVNVEVTNPILKLSSNIIDIDGRKSKSAKITWQFVGGGNQSQYTIEIVENPEFGNLVLSDLDSIEFNSLDKIGVSSFAVQAVDSSGNRSRNIEIVSVKVGYKFRINLHGLVAKMNFHLINSETMKVVDSIEATGGFEGNTEHVFSYRSSYENKSKFKVVSNPFTGEICSHKSTRVSFRSTLVYIHCNADKLRRKNVINLVCAYHDINDMNLITDLTKYLGDLFTDTSVGIKAYWNASSYVQFDINSLDSQIIYLEKNESEYISSGSLRSLEIMNDCIEKYKGLAPGEEIINVVVPAINKLVSSFSLGKRNFISIPMNDQFQHQVLGIMIHELGHSLGFPHSLAGLPESSLYEQYSNPYDVMSFHIPSGWHCELGALSNRNVFRETMNISMIFDNGIECGKDQILDLPQDTHIVNKLLARWLGEENIEYKTNIESGIHIIDALASNNPVSKKTVIIELNKASWIVIESRIKTGIDQSLADEATVIYKVNLTEYQRLRVEIVSHLREIGDAFKIELNSNDFIIQLVAQHSQSHEIYIGQ